MSLVEEIAAKCRDAGPEYTVFVKDGHWSYVIGSPMPKHWGPYRYREDAQDYADELNEKTEA